MLTFMQPVGSGFNPQHWWLAPKEDREAPYIHTDRSPRGESQALRRRSHVTHRALIYTLGTTGAVISQCRAMAKSPAAPWPSSLHGRTVRRGPLVN